MKLMERFNRFRFDRAVRAIKDTPMVRNDTNGPILLSMVQHRDVLPYLLAIKSCAVHVAPSRVVVVADPTLDSGDRALMSGHVPGIEFVEAVDYRRPGIPQGGCWERLNAIAEFVAGGYVIQLDADTVAVAPMPEVISAVRDGVAFTLGTEDDSAVVSCKSISDWAKNRRTGNDHVQLIAESVLADIEGADSLRYVRGCAGFAGYPKGSFGPEAVASLSKRMKVLMPDKWDQWGSEQFTSNVLVASMPRSRVLPHPKYCAPHRRNADTCFLHFIGYVRYSTPLYAQMAKRLAGELARR